MRRFTSLGILIIVSFFAWANWPTSSLPSNIKVTRILVNKSARTLTLFSGNNLIKSYSISLERNPLGQKQQEGDKKNAGRVIPNIGT